MAGFQGGCAVVAEEVQGQPGQPGHRTEREL